MHSITSLCRILGVFLFMLVTSVTAQDTIYWNKHRPLKWEDFKGIPVMNEKESAQATTGVALEFQFRETLNTNSWEYRYNVHSYFLPALSWYKPNEINYYLLEHEQTHFNISELFARKLKKELSELVPSESLGEDAECIYNKLQKDHAVLQNKYDKESNHSLNINRELEWQKSIQDSLKIYNDWK